MDDIQKSIEKFKELLLPKASELNHGYYRFLSYARKKIEEFLDGYLKEKLIELDKIDSSLRREVVEELYKFFSRYYKDGELIGKGIEFVDFEKNVLGLYWADQNRYYVKTALFFRDHSFKIDDYEINLKIISAEEEKGGNKELKPRFFFISESKPYEVGEKSLTINFEYRELTEKDKEFYELKSITKSGTQKEINKRVFEFILNNLQDEKLKTILTKTDKNKKALFLKHLNSFTQKRVKDYFIHKDLKGFLSKQLEYFVKFELMKW